MDQGRNVQAENVLKRNKNFLWLEKYEWRVVTFLPISKSLKSFRKVNIKRKNEENETSKIERGVSKHEVDYFSKKFVCLFHPCIFSAHQYL